MSSQSIGLSKELHDYVVAVGVHEIPAQTELRDVTSRHAYSNMQISPEQGAFMQFLIRVMGAKRCLEIGTFTGYSALTMGLATGPEGHITCLDLSEEYVNVGRPYWAQAGVSERIDVLIGPAESSLEWLLASGATYDFAFIDADKTGYRAYYEACLKLVRSGGVIAIDNTLWSGHVADLEHTDPDTVALRELNAFIHEDARVRSMLLPVGDGLTLVEVL